MCGHFAFHFVFQDTAQAYQISAMPTFKFEHKGKVIATVTGADRNKLESKLQELSQTVNSLQAAKGDPGVAPGMVCFWLVDTEDVRHKCFLDVPS